MMRLVVAMTAALVLSGCAGLLTASTTATPGQATSVAEAVQATTLAEQAVDLYVKAGNPNKAVLAELNVLVPAVHGSLVAVEAANANGNSAVAAAALAAFNEAYTAYQTYAAKQGVTK